MTSYDSSARVLIGDLAKEIAEQATDAHPDGWQKTGADNDLRHDIAAAITTHGLPTSKTNIPSILTHIRNMCEMGYRDTDGKLKQITPRHPFNGLPAVSVTDIGLDWYLSENDAASVRLILNSERVIDEGINRLNETMKVVFSAPPHLYSFEIDGSPTFNADGYSLYLEEKKLRNAKGRYTVAEAAQVLADTYGFRVVDFVARRMVPAFKNGLLRVIDPADGGPVRGRELNIYADEVTPAVIDAWLNSEGFAADVRWPDTAPLTIEGPEPPIPEERTKKTTWRDVAWDYVITSYRAGQFSTAKELFKRLEQTAGIAPSPFERSNRLNANSLYIRDISQTLSLKTIQNAWIEIKAER